MKLALALLMLSVVLAQQPARDSGSRLPAASGTASIAGTVVADDSSGRPIPRARVSLATSDGVVGRNETADDNGAFAFRNLPAGRYALSASKPAWLTANFGATRPGRPGTPIAIADGAQLTGIVLKMARGAVVTGVVRDVTGQPAVGARVQVSRIATRNGERYLEGIVTETSSAETDDTGTYRLFGLPPGDVIVSAAWRSTQVVFTDDAGTFRRITPDDMNRANQLVRQGGAAELAPPGAPVRTATVFYPGTTDANGATVLSLSAGDERAGIDLTLQIVPTSRIEGMVTDANGVPPGRTMVVAVSGGLQFGGRMAVNGAVSTSTDSNGRYQLTGLAPGEYTLMGDGNRSWAETNVTVSGQDLNVPLLLQPLLTMSGRVVFEGGPAPAPSGLRYSVIASGRMASLLALAIGGTVDIRNGAGTFTSDIVPAKYQLQFRGIPSGWYPKSAMARGVDTFDVPVEIRAGDQLTEFVVTFTDKPSELTGSLVDATGRPAPEYFVVVFSTDRKFWTQQSRRVVQVRPGNDGTFSVKGLPAGDYFIAALTDIEPGESLTAEFLESLIASAPPVQIKIVDGQRTTQPLKIGG